MGNGLVRRASHDIMAVQIIAGHGNGWFPGVEPSFAGAEARHRLALGDMFQIIPIVKFVRRCVGIIKYREQ